jgi:hypothetical protein
MLAQLHKDAYLRKRQAILAQHVVYAPAYCVVDLLYQIPASFAPHIANLQTSTIMIHQWERNVNSPLLNMM